jgi:hypothetical protein
MNPGEFTGGRDTMSIVQAARLMFESEFGIDPFSRLVRTRCMG